MFAVRSAGSGADPVTSVVETGFAVLEGVVPVLLADRIHAELASAPEQEFVREGPHSQVARQGLKFESVLALLDLPEPVAAVDELLSGQGYVLSSTIRRVGPAAPRQNLHSDFPASWPPVRRGRSLFSTHALLVLAHYPGGLNAELGGFHVIPNSHQHIPSPLAGSEELFPGPRDLLLFDASVRHGGGANRTADAIRWGVFVDLAPSYVRRPAPLEWAAPARPSPRQERLLDDRILRDHAAP